MALRRVILMARGTGFARTVLALSALAILGLIAPALTHSAPIRIAVGPYFATHPYQQLQVDCRLLPELLASELAKRDGVKLVERGKVDTLGPEWGITANGLASREKAIQLGQVLDCDWFVNGSLIYLNGRSCVWTKLTDVRTGVIADLHLASYDGREIVGAAQSIAAFVSRAAVSTQRKHYVAIWPVADLKPATKVKRNDWGRRIAPILERHCLEMGVGIVESDTMQTLLDERRNETNRFALPLEQQMTVQPAFWLVDGGWFESANQIIVGLRTQRMGGPQELIWLTNTPASLKAAVVKAMTLSLSRTNEPVVTNPKADAHQAFSRAFEMTYRQSRFWLQHLPARTRWDEYNHEFDYYRKEDDRKRVLIAAHERALSLDPDNLVIKQELGSLYLWSGYPKRWNPGVELLRQVSAGSDPELARVAQNSLDHLEHIAETVKGGKTGPWRPPRPTDWESIQQAYSEDPEDAQACFEFARQLYFRSEASKEGRDKACALMRKIVQSSDREYGEPAQTALNDWTALEQTRTQSLARQERPPAFDFAACHPYLQEKFSRFVPAQFEKGSNELAILQTLPASSAFLYRGKYFYGFRFTIPKDIDGDFEWAFLFAKTAATEKHEGTDGQFWILPKTGTMEGFKSRRRFDISRFPKLKKQFSRSDTVIYQTLSRDSIVPGGEYAIWFAFEEPNPPDVAFALTMDSEEGHRRFGQVPLE